MDEKQLKENSDILDDIISTFETTKEISIYEYSLYQSIRNKFNDYLENVDKDNKELGWNLLIENIKIKIEKIVNLTKNKKEYEFISDYFMNQTHSLSHTQQNNSNINETLTEFELKHKLSTINDNFIQNIEPLNNSNSLNDIKTLLSPSFLESNMKLSHDDINKIKALTQFETLSKKQNGVTNTQQVHMNDINKLTKKKKRIKQTKSSSSSNNNEQLNKEIEDELQEQIFGYTKSMKENAKHFGEALKRDNIILSEIENIQNIDQEKTTTQVSRLKEFNYSIRLGFCKLMGMFAIVFITFLISLFVMKVFPKFSIT
jgi:hypothetical protein